MVRSVGAGQGPWHGQGPRTENRPAGNDNNPAGNEHRPEGNGNRPYQGRPGEGQHAEKQPQTPFNGALDSKTSFEATQNLQNKRGGRPNPGGNQSPNQNYSYQPPQDGPGYNPPAPGEEQPAYSPGSPENQTPADPQNPNPVNPPNNDPNAPETPVTPGNENKTNGQTGVVDGGGPNELVLKNTDSTPMTIALFENTGPGMNPNINDPNNRFTVQPGESITLSMPESWQGRAQKLSGNPDDPATWAEINYENKNGEHKLWYDNSLIRGYNSAVTIKPTNSNDPSEVAGSGKSLLSNAPDSVLTTDAGGNTVIKDVEPYTGGVNSDVENYLNGTEGESNSYIRFDDHKAVRTSTDNSLTVTFGAA